ncbi:FMN-binding negative transcriptional regulator [Pseudoblastomonas halimionae]|uniref:FMN-binding negative transcriptional regulator n=1 Tax=Alteriqipengyuania halimionae TaxID=1926630 RepID=A0A6I4U5N7_9SPHN|nr:FMN-binding negative transcriptional regulator [Alteriqipengyuania halimionae]MXP10215.1 FMN-binding negative transcriptional regulator [Alteriqipengyuania halimionae]
MHPNPAYRHADRALLEDIVDQVGFGMLFASTPDGPRVAHVPIVSTRDGAIQFHVARANGITRHLEGATALALVNGPDSYVSARWYDEPAKQVPTWDYIAVEMEGPVRRMADEGLRAHLEELTTRNEARIEGGEPWRMAEADPAYVDKLLRGIVGFEMEVMAWRETMKLHQGKPDQTRAHIADRLDEQGAGAIAHLMRSLPS